MSVVFNETDGVANCTGIICGAGGLGKWMSDCIATVGGIAGETDNQTGTQNSGTTPGATEMVINVECVVPAGKVLAAGDHIVTWSTVVDTFGAGLKWKKTTVCQHTTSTCVAVLGGSLGTLDNQNINVAKIDTHSMTITCTVPTIPVTTLHSLNYQISFRHPTGQSKYIEVDFNGTVTAPLVPAYTPVTGNNPNITPSQGKLIITAVN